MEVDQETISMFKDLRNVDLPRDIENAVDKIKCDIEIGKRIYWYFPEDLRYCQEHNLNPRQDDYSGIIIVANGLSVVNFEWEDCIVIQDRYPAQKEYCMCAWVALNRLLDSDVVEIYEKSET